jgi:hypothetical protein
MGEARRDELEDLLGLGQPPKVIRPQIPALDALGEKRVGGSRHEYLAAVAGEADPGRAMDVDS